MISLDKLSDEFRNNVDLIVDAGKTKVGIASTIIKVNGDKVEVLRKRTY